MQDGGLINGIHGLRKLKSQRRGDGGEEEAKVVKDES